MATLAQFKSAIQSISTHNQVCSVLVSGAWDLAHFISQPLRWNELARASDTVRS